MKKEKETLRKELEKEAPLLAQLKERPEGLSVPEGYFGQLRQNVLQELAAPPKRRLIRTWHYLAAACVVALAGAALFLFRPEPAQPEHGSIALTSEEMLQYISQNIDEFDVDMLLPYATAYISTENWLEEANPDDPEMQEYMNDLLDDIDLETLEELL